MNILYFHIRPFYLNLVKFHFFIELLSNLRIQNSLFNTNRLIKCLNKLLYLNSKHKQAGIPGNKWAICKLRVISESKIISPPTCIFSFHQSTISNNCNFKNSKTIFLIDSFEIKNRHEAVASKPSICNSIYFPYMLLKFSVFVNKDNLY